MHFDIVQDAYFFMLKVDSQVLTQTSPYDKSNA